MPGQSTVHFYDLDDGFALPVMWVCFAFLAVVGRTDGRPLEVLAYGWPQLVASGVAIIGLVAAVSGRKPAHGPADGSSRPLPNLATLPRARREKLLRQRNAAIRTWAKRSLLEGAPERLQERPLGRLDR